jgi:translation initiation factor eIF-2B subunit epsilon
VKPIISNKARSVGDFLREIEQMDIFTEDFVMCSGDIITNLDLAPYIKKHK